MQQRLQSNELFEISISNANEFFDVSSNVIIESKTFFSAETTIHLSNSKAKISSIDSISKLFTIIVLIFDKSHDIFFKISENSSTNDFEIICENENNQKVTARLRILTVILIFFTIDCSCFEINRNSYNF